MKQIKFLIAIALVSVIAISCKETPKEEVIEAPAVEEVQEEVAPVVDSLAVEATEEVEAPAAE